MKNDIKCKYVVNASCVGVNGNVVLREGEDKYVAFFDMPGCIKDDIELKITNGVIKVKAKRMLIPFSESLETIYQSSSTEFGTYAYTLYINDAVCDFIDYDNVEAIYNNGVLILTMPKIVKRVPKSKAIKVM